MGFMKRNKIILCIMFIIFAIIFSYSHLTKAQTNDIDFSIIGPTSKDPQHVIVEIHTTAATFELKLDKDKVDDVEYIYEYVKYIQTLAEKRIKNGGNKRE